MHPLTEDVTYGWASKRLSPWQSWVYTPKRYMVQTSIQLSYLFAPSDLISSIIVNSLRLTLLHYYRDALNDNGKKSVSGVIKRTPIGGQNGGNGLKTNPQNGSAAKPKPSVSRYFLHG